MNGGIAIAVVILIFGVLLMTRQSSVDLASPLRDWFNRRDVAKLARRAAPPETMERAYWSLREYQRDAERLRALGYEVQSEKLSAPRFINPIVQEAYDEGSPMFRFQVQPTKHRVPVARIFYQLRGSTRNATPGQESIERDG